MRTAVSVGRKRYLAAANQDTRGSTVRRSVGISMIHMLFALL